MSNEVLEIITEYNKPTKVDTAFESFMASFEDLPVATQADFMAFLFDDPWPRPTTSRKRLRRGRVPLNPA